MRDPKSRFQTVTAQGGLFPVEFLARITPSAARDAPEGLDPASYHLPGSERLTEAVNRSWNLLRGRWEDFSRRAADLAPAEHGTGLTRDHWLRPLFQELGFGQIQPPGGKIVIEDREYPVSHIWNTVPIHLLGFRIDLDRRTPGAAGAARMSPHAMVQEYLNRTPATLWGIVTNGYRLRLLRDNAALTRLAFIEFDLQSMFDGNHYADFALLWLLCHQSRFEADRPELCWLEKWTQEARKLGVRLLEHLRDGVQTSIEHLGTGFLAHSANQGLRDKLHSGQLNKEDYYRQVLRLVYRLIFLFVAEDRDLLLLPEQEANGEQGAASGNATNPANPPSPSPRSPLAAPSSSSHSPFTIRHSLYIRFYSTRRLRELALKRAGTAHGDLWEALSLVMRALGSDKGCPELALPSLGSFLWSDEALPDLIGLKLANRHLLDAVRVLASTKSREERVRRVVDYENLGAEELGSVYESLLELHPEINLSARSFRLSTAAGNERKTSGSYYTPDSLVQCLLDSALEPVMEERLAEARRMANGEGRAASGEQRAGGDGKLTETEKRYVYQVLSGSRSMAAGDGHGCNGVQSDEALSSGRGIRDDLADSTRGGLDPSQHRGGLGTRDDQGVSAIPPYSAGQLTGTGNSSPVSRPGGADQGGATSDGRGCHSGAPVDLPSAEPYSEARFLKIWSSTPLAARRSLLAEKALLSLRVCDPAVGSGHFLIAAAHRMAKRLAAVRSGEGEPVPDAVRTALRDVIGHCLYGVDINPMSAELCRVSLWLEALEPGKPLSFLDHHIRVGNSLLGATPELIANGLPDDAFNPIEGDDKKVCAGLKRQNKLERQGQQDMFHKMVAESGSEYNSLVDRSRSLADAPDDTLAAVRAKADRFRQLVVSPEYRHAQLIADAWCAAFVWPKTASGEQRAASSSGSSPRSPLAARCSPPPPTTDTIHRLQENPAALSHGQTEELQRLSEQYQFFHWHLAFPEVFQPLEESSTSNSNPWNSSPHSLSATSHPAVPKPSGEGGSPHAASGSGFDVVLGNPPWERVKLQEKEWFAERSPEIANAPNAAARKKLIKELISENPTLYESFLADSRKAEGESHILRDSGIYPLCGRGDVNLYAVFVEGMRNILDHQGRSGAVLPSGIATDDTTKFFFQNLVDTRSLVSFYDFENKNLFPSVHSSYKFCLLTAGNGEKPAADAADFAFFCHAVEDLRDPGRRFTLTPEDIALLNPNTRTCSIFRSVSDAILTASISKRNRCLYLMETEAVAFDCFSLTRVYDLTLDKDLLVSSGDSCPAGYGPLHEGKAGHQFNHRFASWNGQNYKNVNTALLSDPAFATTCQFYAPIAEARDRLNRRNPSTLSGLLSFRRVARNTDERTMVACILPFMPTSYSWIHAIGPNASDLVLLTSIFNCFPFDYLLRNSLSQPSLPQSLVEQIRVPNRTAEYEQFSPHLRILTLELTYTAWDLEPFARDCGYDGPPFRWDEERRFEIRCELDAAFFHLYLPADAHGGWRQARIADGAVHDETADELAALKAHFPTPRHAVAYIMDTFPIVKRKDEAAHGTYRTKNRILEIYDAMAEVMKANGEWRMANGKSDSDPAPHAYHTRLNPPPGPPCDTDGAFIPVAKWNPNHWPTHIHPPKAVR